MNALSTKQEIAGEAGEFGSVGFKLNNCNDPGEPVYGRRRTHYDFADLSLPGKKVSLLPAEADSMLKAFVPVWQQWFFAVATTRYYDIHEDHVR